MAKLLKRLQAIEELDCVLQNWCSDDDKRPEDYSMELLLDLAVERRAEFYDTSHTLCESLQGYHGPEEKRYAKSQLAKINRWIQAANKAVNEATK
jgi:hypothetical protein